MNLEQKQNDLTDIIRDLGSVAVAFSAGVDSTYLLAVCVDVLGAARARAFTACSPSLPAHELDAARALARQIGAHLEIVTTHELHNPAYARNDEHRCFHCKDELFATLRPLSETHSLDVLVYGATADDVGDYRPGMQAAQQHGARAPLLEAGLGKDDIRALSRRRGLPTHDKPAMACLASRIAYGRPVTAAVLRQVEQAEQFLRREMGLRQVRVRHHGEIARLEVEAEEIVHLAQPEARARVVAHLREIGFTYVTLDLAGFRSGSMNEVMGKHAAVSFLEPCAKRDGSA